MSRYTKKGKAEAAPRLLVGIFLDPSGGIRCEYKVAAGDAARLLDGFARKLAPAPAARALGRWQRLSLWWSRFRGALWRAPARELAAPEQAKDGAA